MRDACEDVSGGPERVINFCNECIFSKKGFDDFNYFSQYVELREFVKKIFVPDTIECFLHIKEDGGGVNVVKVLAKLVGKLG